MAKAADGEPRMEVLVVEDHRDSRELLIEYLEVHGFTVKAATNGLQALAQLEEGPPPVAILTDLHMPLMDGWTLRAELAKDPRFADIPVVVLSAMDVSMLPEAVHASMQKPLDLKRVVAILRRLAQRQP